MSYPCPNCNSPASPQTGCPRCGRGPDADAAEVVRLDAEIADLTAKLGYARQAVRDIPPLIEGARARRNAAAARVRAARVQPTAPPPPPPPLPQRPAAPVRVRGSEASTKLVQNLLFLLGGLLLAVAAIVFTAVAWAQFGVGGRAALLASFTGATLAVPPVALRRKLSATAETFAAVGLLLVLLDGYAAWYVNLFGVAHGSPWGYAGAVCAVTAAVAAGYEHVTGLTGPRFAALVVAQPVVPLLAVPVHPDATGWALAFAAVGALDVAVLALRRARFQVAGVGIAAYLCGAASTVVAGCCALVGLAVADTAASAAAAGGALLVPALVVLAAAVLARNPVAQAVTGGLAVVALDVAGIGVALRTGSSFAPRVGPGFALLRIAIVTLVVVALTAAARRLLPPVVARGPRAGALAVVTVPVLAACALTAEAAVSTLDAAGPFLGAGWSATVPYAGWSLLISIVLLAAALMLVAPAAWRGTVLLGAAVLTGLALPAGLQLRWWSAPIFDLIVAAAALAAAIRYVAPTVTSPAGQSPNVPSGQSVSSPDVSVGQSASSPNVSAGQSASSPNVSPEQSASSPNVPAEQSASSPNVSAGQSAAPVGAAPTVSVSDGRSALPPSGAVQPATAPATALATGIRMTPAASGPLVGPAFFFGVQILAVVLLGLHAVTAGFGRAGVAAGVLGAVAALGFVTAALTRTGPRRRDLGGAGLLTGLVAVPAIAWTTAVALSAPPAVQSRIVLAAVTPLVAVLWAIARRAPFYRPFALTAVLLAVVSAPAWALAAGDPPAVYAAVALLLLALTLPGTASVPAVSDSVAARGGVPSPAISEFVAARGGVSSPAVSEFVAARGGVSSPAVAARGGLFSVAGSSAGGLGAELGWTAITAVPLASALFVATGRSLFRVLLEPYQRLAPIWAGRPTGLPHVPAVDAVALVLAGVAAAVAGYLLPTGRDGDVSGAVRRRAAAWAGLPVLAVAVPVVMAAARAPWPAVPGAELALGVAGLLLAALRRTPLSVPVVGTLLAGAGLAGALPTHASTLAGLGVVLIAGAVAGNSGRSGPIRVTGWLLAVAAAFGVAGTTGDALELDLRVVAFIVLGTAAIAFALSWVLTTHLAAPPTGAGRAGEARAVEAAAHAGALLALLLTDGSIRHTAAVCFLWGVALGVRALGWTGSGAGVAGSAGRRVATAARHGYVVAAAVAEFAGWCLLMAAANVSTVEVYTIPAAAVAVLAGLLARRRHPKLSSWTAYGPALAAALLPSLASIAGADGQYPRRLLLGLGALAIVVAGANARLKAPVLMGGAALVLLALHELAQVWDLIPRWIPLAAGGLLLVLLAMTLERRRRDLARFRAALIRMS